MSSLILPRRFYSQPASLPECNTDFGEVKTAYLFGRMYDAALRKHRRIESQSGAPITTLTTTPAGPAVSVVPNYSSGRLFLPYIGETRLGRLADRPFTLVLVCNLQRISPYYVYLGCMDESFAVDGYSLRLGATVITFYTHDGASHYYSASLSGAASVNGVDTVVAHIAENNKIIVAVNGSLIMNASYIPWIDRPYTHYFYSWGSGIRDQMSLFAAIKGRQTPECVVALSANPWKIFRVAE